MLQEMNKQFDIDLSFGQQGETWLTLLADERKLEVKRDRLWHKTGNIFFECLYKGEQSGVLATAADYFCYILTKEGRNITTYLFSVPPLKLALFKLDGTGVIKYIKGAGDGGYSSGYLVPLSSIGTLTKTIAEMSNYN